MICPQCGTEYVEGVADCPECHIPLITGTAKDWEREEEFIELVPVYTTGNLAFVAVAKSVLDGAGIVYNVKNEQIQNLWGLGSMGNNLAPMIFEVEKERAQEAKTLLQELEQGGLWDPDAEPPEDEP
jgi:hypothetical protein